MKSHAIRVHEHGGPGTLRFEALEATPPGPGEVLLRHTAVGVNFIDTYHRSGLYPVPLPAVIGSEGAGVVAALGAGVSELAVGDRVAYAGALGSYCELRTIAAERLVPLPPTIGEEAAAAVLLKGLTAWYLLRRTHRVTAGETILVHAAAGGVGTLLCPWARALGARVIGTVGAEAKVELARAHGCQEVIDTSREDFVARVRQLTGGAGVPVVYDGVGRATFQGSLDCLAPRGLMVSFGNASGPVPPLDILELAARGSLFLTRPALATYVASRADLLAGAGELFEAVERGSVRVTVGQRYPLAAAAQAHEDLEGRRTVGASLLLP